MFIIYKLTKDIRRKISFYPHNNLKILQTLHTHYTHYKTYTLKLGIINSRKYEVYWIWDIAHIYI